MMTRVESNRNSALKPTLRQLSIAAGLAASLFLAAGCQSSKSDGAPATSSSGTGAAMYPPVQTKASQAAMTPQQALAELQAGNHRFVTGRPGFRDLPAQVKATAAGQYPFAVILSCLDSRQSVELIFDQGIGDVFNARIAGNVLNDDILGSLEFACKASGAKLIAVVGHSNCGAVKGAVDDVQLGSLTGLLDKIKPAIAGVPDDGQPRKSSNLAFVDKVAEANVHLVMKEIQDRSPILKEMISQGQIGLVGGMYDLSTGEVKFYPQ